MAGFGASDLVRAPAIHLQARLVQSIRLGSMAPLSFSMEAGTSGSWIAGEALALVIAASLALCVALFCACAWFVGRVIYTEICEARQPRAWLTTAARRRSRLT